MEGRKGRREGKGGRKECIRRGRRKERTRERKGRRKKESK